FLSNKKYKRYLSVTNAAAVIIEDPLMLPAGKSGLISSNPYLTFAEAMEFFYPSPQAITGVDRLAIVSPTARLGEKVSIGPFTVIGDNVEIGDQVLIMSHCTIYPNAQIGAGSVIHSHCVVREGCDIGVKVILQDHVTIGSDGFG